MVSKMKRRSIMQNIKVGNRIHHLGILSILSILLLMGCVDRTDNYVSKSGGEKVEIEMSLIALSNSLSTRSGGMSINTIDLTTLQVLAFEVLDSGEELFRYEAPVKSSISNQRIVIEAHRSVIDEKYRFVVLANMDKQTIDVGTAKERVLNMFTFVCSGKWNSVEPNNITPAPMWGELIEPFVVDKRRYVNILMNMALARVDVGLNFLPQDEDNQTDEVHGLENFKLTSVRVYRTKNKGYVASSLDKLDGIGNPIETNIPLDAVYNLDDGTTSADIDVADQSPLLYQVDLTENPQGLDKIVREIYIPESYVLQANSSMDEVPCLVIGGYYGVDNIASDNPIETFYRLDFAHYRANTPVVESYKEILRNHRYVFNIRSISDPGFPDEDKALNSLPTNINLVVEDWREMLLNTYVQGNYFFGIDSRNIEVPTADIAGDLEKPIGYDSNAQYANYVWVKIPYRSNIDRDKFAHSWATSSGTSSDEFGLIIDEDYFWFGANPNLPEDASAAPLEARQNSLHLKILDMEIDIHVKQEPSNLIYLIDCNSLKVNGKYREGGTLNYTHSIDLLLRSPVTVQDAEGADIPYSIDDKRIYIYTKTRKGIYFVYDGILSDDGIVGEVKNIGGVNVREYAISLRGYGTPAKDPNDPISPDDTNPEAYLMPLKNLVISTNSVSSFGNESVGNLNCMTDIIFGYRSKKILTIGSNAAYRYGYVLEENSGSRAFVDAAINFGIAPNSAVTIAQLPQDYPKVNARNRAFDIEVMTRGSGMSGSRLDNTVLNDLLINFEPDIILMGYHAQFDPENIGMIADFVNKGGVLIMFMEYYPNSNSIRDLVNGVMGTNFEGGNIGLNRDEFMFMIPTDDEDPIINGPFGNLGGKEWGTDGYSLYKFTNFNDPNTKVYNRTPIENEVCAFHHFGPRTDGSGLEKAFFFIGDGGFLSNAQRFIGPQYQGMHDYCPFAIDAQYRPIARTNFLWRESNGPFSTYNSQLFGNILAWAIDYAEFKGINKDK